MTKTTNKRDRRTFTDEFKNQIVQLYLNGKRKTDIVKEYDLSATALEMDKASTINWLFQRKGQPIP